ncbi:type I glyceraldehyde-3-phosphate dehydrogenase [Paracoccaceae bacterium]|jgi:glyceraldehyde 3-phosphate dehydrogenase|nr:type I glyceraldehyde-3-phosphate dehydrogenase [Marinovum sp.]MBT3649916.1 type I glyceraldehyde-3-phosphate dehydrogenase [Paracoccaceae bacterium]MBT4229214.1 type I glyceraldehyde-3-phosphate dehydrogenase [Paracoccaceae bacterium]MBT4954312.1 type I glyceraldehyde-3-phosphate dehydrogenase [Paracoccaceae bacterium]MBT5317269.1 type I glyceraldehyde-3-phosphate dehydrogenase [Paracoccaceae bacterium]|tara:strand:- start:69 stop:1073 length:1005 start_codon:yes stop_codon:yes gene_type:complete
MTTKIAINGFGRIGRNILRAFSENPRNDLEVIAINDLGPVQTNAHLLKYDSVHGRFGTEIEITDNSIDIGHGPIAVTAIRNPAELPWKDVDIVLECTGFFTERATAAQHLENGAARVIVSAPCKDADKTIVYGVNHGALSDQDIVISNASCTTNCLAPVAQVLNDSIGLKRGFMTTIHSYTGDQPTLDTMHKDLYRARSAALNMIPTTTGAARAVGLVMPDLLGKLDGVSIRVPTPNVSCVDLTFEASRDTTINEINAAFEAAAAEGTLKGVLGTTNEPLVSMDFNHDSRSSIVALDQTKVMEGTMCRILSWYDNEWGFSNRMLDTATQMAKFL